MLKIERKLVLTMKLTKQEQKYQAKQQLASKFRPQDININMYNSWPFIKVDTTQLLKRVVR